MTDELKIGARTIRLLKGDITEMEVDAFVYYARSDLNLGSGLGGAIAARGGPKIQEELKKIGEAGSGEAVTSAGGNLKAKFIIHAVGPRFQEADTEGKLKAAMLSAFRQAEEKKVQSLAFPAMGAGFYGIPLETCAQITLAVTREYLIKTTCLKEVTFCLVDSRELSAFQKELRKIKGGGA
jgi:O-acetyl-ADP-ribose deacetylase